MADKPSNKGPLRILCVDDGGLTGHLGLLLLHELEKRTKKGTKELFDIFSGISAGSLFAGMMCIPDLSALEAFDQFDKIIHDCKKLSFREKLKRGFGLLSNKYCDEIKWNIIVKIFGSIKINEINQRIVIPVWDNIRKMIRVYDNKYESDYLSDIIHKSTSIPLIYSETTGRLKKDEYSESDLGFVIAQPYLFVLTNLFEEIKERGAILVSIGQKKGIKQEVGLNLFQKGIISGLSQLIGEYRIGSLHFNDRIINKFGNTDPLSIDFCRLVPSIAKEKSSNFKSIGTEKMIQYMYESTPFLEVELDKIARKLIDS